MITELVGDSAVLGEHHQWSVLSLGVVDPGTERGCLADAGDVERSGDSAGVHLIVAAGVEEDDLVGIESACQFGGVVLVQRREWPENDRALLVLTLHPAEVGVCIRLAVEHLIDEALLVVALDIPGPTKRSDVRSRRWSTGAHRELFRRHCPNRDPERPGYGPAA